MLHSEITESIINNLPL